MKVFSEGSDIVATAECTTCGVTVVARSCDEVHIDLELLTEQLRQARYHDPIMYLVCGLCGSRVYLSSDYPLTPTPSHGVLVRS